MVRKSNGGRREWHSGISRLANIQGIYAEYAKDQFIVRHEEEEQKEENNNDSEDDDYYQDNYGLREIAVAKDHT